MPAAVAASGRSQRAGASGGACSARRTLQPVSAAYRFAVSCGTHAGSRVSELNGAGFRDGRAYRDQCDDICLIEFQVPASGDFRLA